MEHLSDWLQDSFSYLLDESVRGKLRWLATPAAAGLVAYTLYSWRQGRELPPGPVGLPLFGRLPWISQQQMHLSMLKACQDFGDVCSFYLGSRLFIVVNSYPLIREMLESSLFAGRPQLRVFKKLTRNCGIIFTERDAWSQQRRLSMRTLRDLGFGREQTVQMIDNQLDNMFATFDEIAALYEPIHLQETFLLASNSVITEMTLGRRFEINDATFQQVNSTVKRLVEEGIIQNAAFLYPAIERLAYIVPASSSLVRDFKFLHEVIRGEIRKREAMISDESMTPQCLCDAYIQEKRKAEKAGDFETFKEFQIIRVTMEFFLAGTDTTARSMEWLLLYMAFYPEVQDRVQQELDSVVSRSRRPRMQDKTQLHYTSAVIDEAYRKASLAAIGVFHRAVEDTTFHGYRIPSDAVILPLIYGVHHRPEYWEKPNEFYPEHFLDESGRYRSSPYLIPFLIGRRSCVGESLARMEIFLFFTAIMQRYRVRPEPESMARKQEILAGSMGTFIFPGDYEVTLDRR